jgi:hypothetical protein
VKHVLRWLLKLHEAWNCNLHFYQPKSLIKLKNLFSWRL